MNRRACQLQKALTLAVRSCHCPRLGDCWLYAKHRRNDLLPERATNSMPSCALTGPAAVAHHGVQSQGLEGSLSCKGCKVSLQGGLLTAPALSISTVLLLPEYTHIPCQPHVSLHMYSRQDRIQAAPDVLKTCAILQHLIMHAHSMAVENGRVRCRMTNTPEYLGVICVRQRWQDAAAQ